MKQIVLASTSTLFGEEYLAYLRPVLEKLFAGVKEIVFIPYARPGGISHDDYTSKAAGAFKELGIAVRGLHTFDNPAAALDQAQGIFTGGGNTFVLVKALHDNGLMQHLKQVAEKGTPYLGCSAGTNIGGQTMQTTNDMPIVYPSSFQTTGLVPFNINPHYLDPIEGSHHMGETRETRIREFHSQNTTPVVGLREGSWLQVNGEEITLGGKLTARIFEQGKAAYEVESGSTLQHLK
ncbi:dipeptidase PepE [Chitinophaga sp. Cy-1792]|uniref:dipeptidase PepE n=1 Tax=Chitinophaga sp. Cy-1792 TaxID=2608339 RepID=UPI001423CE92|nr:dipeptidase PepE [Chitinophaga sp. Cy-1792]NIG54173.1 dipeptidase PepE [Chitinophaga sp. Cy-1792]